MIGRYFREQLKARRVEYYSGENQEDFEMLYTLVLEARAALPIPMEEDEQIGLTVLCGIWWPGKTPAYQAEAHEFRQRFRGVAYNPVLQMSFRSMIGQSILRARSPDDLIWSLSANFVTRSGGTSRGETMGY
jgi:hypothetical protein